MNLSGNSSGRFSRKSPPKPIAAESRIRDWFCFALLGMATTCEWVLPAVGSSALRDTWLLIQQEVYCMVSPGWGQGPGGVSEREPWEGESPSQRAGM